MIKRLIFDLDNTLIDWEDNYWDKGIRSTCLELNIEYDYELMNSVKKVIDNYEKNNEYFDIEIMQRLINNELNTNYDIKFIKTMLKYFEKCVPEKIDKNTIKTLEYLKDKYELVVLTNWFEGPQIKRLENVGIYKYFKKVYGTEKIKIKPNKEAFMKAKGNCKLSECIMIGDNLKIDIDGAIMAGMSAIFLNKKNIKVDEKYKVINKLDDLIEIL